MKMRSLGIHPNPIGLVSLRRGRDFPSKPLVKTLPSNAGAVGSIPGQGTRPHTPHGQKKQNIKEQKQL